MTEPQTHGPDCVVWERCVCDLATPCTHCGMPHNSGTACPSLEFPGTEWDQ